MAPTRDEFSRLALEQLDALDRFARSLTRSGDSDDLVQETLLRAIKSQHTFDLRSHGIRSWLFRICHNVYLTRGKRENAQPRAVEQETLQSFAAPIIQWEESIENSELNLAMSQLSPELASVLTLWAVDDLSYREIAEVLDVPIGTVMSRLHRARSKLAARLGCENRSELSRKPSTGMQATEME
ncbi:MAG TPA: sigma-70 family RNA polymerase sigma factor [Tepidisphaeraceae bacterium]|nr:sigma-70 family RNA polymerase sigma factor [Tepidisphaeraceae bacterium]